MRDRVDPARHAAHDHRPLRHGARQDAGRFRAVRRVVPAAHEGDAWLREERHVAPDVEHRWRLRDLLELRREFRLAADQRAGAHRDELRQDARTVVQTRLFDRRRRGAADAFQGLELRLRRGQGGLRAPKRRDDEPQTLRADARNERERERRYDFTVFHRTSNSSGIPCPATAEISTTGAPASVRNDRCLVSGVRSAFVRTTTCGLDASSFEYDAASFLNKSYVACGSGLSIGTSTARMRVRSTCCRKRSPSPFPSCAPSMMPGMSATTNDRLSDRPTTPRCGSSVVNG